MGSLAPRLLVARTLNRYWSFSIRDGTVKWDTEALVVATVLQRSEPTLQASIMYPVSLLPPSWSGFSHCSVTEDLVTSTI